MKLGHRANEAFLFDPDYRDRLINARKVAKSADHAWRYYARKVGIDPLAVTESPLTEIAKRRAGKEMTT